MSSIATAMSETGLAQARLNGEVSRSAFQFSLFATAVREGGFLEATIDHAGDTPLGPAPDIRRMLVPLGPVAVFGSSNFPFAFSVLGGDVASAIAAGCPVVVKAHGSHLLTSARSFEVLLEAANAVHAPDGTFGIVYGQAAGVALVKEPAISAVGFTGSLGAANALRAAIDERDEPIPFYGELQQHQPARDLTGRGRRARAGDRRGTVRLVHRVGRPAVHEAGHRVHPRGTGRAADRRCPRRPHRGRPGPGAAQRPDQQLVRGHHRTPRIRRRRVARARLRDRRRLLGVAHDSAHDRERPQRGSRGGVLRPDARDRPLLGRRGSAGCPAPHPEVAHDHDPRRGRRARARRRASSP